MQTWSDVWYTTPYVVTTLPTAPAYRRTIHGVAGRRRVRPKQNQRAIHELRTALPISVHSQVRVLDRPPLAPTRAALFHRPLDC